jgi:hypothetical protein
VVKREKGYRRTPAEVIASAQRHGFEYRTTCYAGFGNEFNRSGLLSRVPLLGRLDRVLHVASNCVVLVFDKVNGRDAAR